MKLKVRYETKSYKLALSEARKKRPDNKKITSLLNRAMRQNDPNAAYALGTWYLHGHIFEKNIAKAIQLLSIAARGLVPDANYDLAISYEKGIGVRKSEKRAFELYLTAALLGEKQSLLEVGRCFYHGIGIRPDRKIARIWLNRAKELGVRRAKNKIK